VLKSGNATPVITFNSFARIRVPNNDGDIPKSGLRLPEQFRAFHQHRLRWEKLDEKLGNVSLRSYFFFRHHIFIRADHIDGSGVERVLDMHPVIFLDHSDARTTVLSDLIDVGSLHQPHADIRAWLDETGASVGVQQKLMRHAHVSTTMDQYGNASALAKRKANRPIVQRLLRRSATQQISIQ
jgi:hypothetical protein